MIFTQIYLKFLLIIIIVLSQISQIISYLFIDLSTLSHDPLLDVTIKLKLNIKPYYHCIHHQPCHHHNTHNNNLHDDHPHA